MESITIILFASSQSTWSCLGVARDEREITTVLKISLESKILSQMLERCKTAEEATTLSKGCQDLLFEVNCLVRLLI